MADIIETPKQLESLKIIANNTTTLLEGGTRSGKTFIILQSLVNRALKYPNTWHICLRLRRKHAETSLWMKTIPDVLKSRGIYESCKLIKDDLIVRFPNDSLLLVDGLDDKDRVDKILGNEYASIFLNEASQISYESYDTLTTRLNPPKNVPPRFLIDYNPPSTQHWGYKIFRKRKFPDGRDVPSNDFSVLRMNPDDNKENISPTLFTTLNNLSGTKKRRFLLGEYGSDEGSLWRREWIKYGNPPANLIRVVIGVDPSGSVQGDEIGIVIAGIDESMHYWILGDYSMHGTPNEWSNEVLRVYDVYKADKIVAEKNFGGDMVEAVITQMGTKAVNVELVTASRGKIVRAEPISAMYERGEVLHAKEFTELEDQYCTWKPEDIESPNNLDASVWALTDLSCGGFAVIDCGN